MLSNYKPTWQIEAIYQLTPEMLHKHGVSAILTDLDNTLIAWNNPNGTEELRQWLKDMKQANIPVVVVSNNSAKRIAKAVQPLGVDFVSRALKPFTRGFKNAEKKLNLPKEKLLMVGDQLMTDIHGSNRAGIRSVLVKPIIETDAWTTKLNRARERKVWKRLEKTYDMSWKKGI
jgi:HAD superfamily phosphatase (TIGR01668 family)